jgi:hypothetical protein
MKFAQKNQVKADYYQLFGEKPSGWFIFSGKQAASISSPFIGHESAAL